MAKAQLTTKSGAVVTVEGTSEEVARLIDLFDENAPEAKRKAKTTARPKSSSKTRKSKAGIAAHIDSLIEEGFFKKPKDFVATKAALQQQGHYYARSAIGTALIRAVRRKSVRRLKENKNWVYVE